MRHSGKGILLLLCMLMLSACSYEKADTKKVRDIEFTVIDPQDIPQELGKQIEENKTAPFRLTYGDSGYLYIARGYGTKDTSGYSVEVPECFEGTNAIYIKTNLQGPSKQEKVISRPTCPYVIIKLEYSDKNVVFQ